MEAMMPVLIPMMLKASEALETGKRFMKQDGLALTILNDKLDCILQHLGVDFEKWMARPPKK